MTDQPSLNILNAASANDLAAADALLRSFETGSGQPDLKVVPRPETTPAAKPESTERQAAPESEETSPTPNSLPSDTPATAANAQTAAPKQNTETQTPAEKGSAFAKDQARLQGGWKTLNEEKGKIAAERQTIQQERIRLQQEQTQWQARQQSANKNKLTPELYEQTAQARQESVEQGKLMLEGLKARRQQMEAAGQYVDAAKLDQQIEAKAEEIAVAKHEATQFKAIAADMRKNPQLDGEALTKQNQQHLQHYTVEAAKKWPELAVAKSEFQKATAQAISTLRGAGLDENHFPVLRYFAAEHVAAQSAAARVPAMDKELAQLRARVKELETNSTPGGGQTAATSVRPQTAVKPESLEAEEQALAREAAQMGRRS